VDRLVDLLKYVYRSKLLVEESRWPEQECVKGVVEHCDEGKPYMLKTVQFVDMRGL
jgi:hypothetical protein